MTNTKFRYANQTHLITGVWHSEGELVRYEFTPPTKRGSTDIAAKEFQEAIRKNILVLV
jgi:hypothetical protein